MFDTTDNLCIFTLKSEEDLNTMRDDIEAFARHVRSLNLPVTVQFAYTIRSGAAETKQSEGDQDSKGLSIVLYKGQRRLPCYGVISPQCPEFAAQNEALRRFFTPVSEVIVPSRDPPLIQSVSHDTFKTEVIEACAKRPVLLQLFERSCFLCFLMRPFVNTLAQILKNHSIAVDLKRLNLDENDFPPGCPVVRSTPNFILYRHPNETERRPWEEYKPTELVQRLAYEFDLSKEVKHELEVAVQQLQERFQKFGLLTVWTQELYQLQQFHLEGKLPNKTTTADSAMDDYYNTAINELVKEDNLRTDTLDTNLQYIEQQISSAEADCLALARMLGPKLLAVENHFHLVKARVDTEAAAARPSERSEHGERLS